MDPLLTWMRVNDGANLSKNSPSQPKPPSTSSSSRAAMYGLFGHEAQCRVAFKALTPTPVPRTRMNITNLRDMRAKALRAAFDEDETALESPASYGRAEEALRYRALWLGNRAAWLIASKSRWRAIRANRQKRLLSAHIVSSSVAQSGSS